MTDPTPRRSPGRLGAALALLFVAAALLALVVYAGRLDRGTPELGWTTPPDAAPVGGVVRWELRTHDVRPGLRSVTLSVDGGEPTPCEPLAHPDDLDGGAPTHRASVDTRRLADGEHTVEIVATDRSWLRNEARLHATVVVDNTAPALAIAERSKRVAQGETLAVWVRADEPLARGEVTFGDRTAPLYPVGDEGLHRALIGVGVEEPPDAHLVTLTAVDRAGNRSTGRYGAMVVDVEWPFGGYVNLDSRQQKAQRDKDRGAEANRKRGDAYDHDEPAQLWDAAFAEPAGGRISSPFGKERTYSTGIRRHHLGVDIANAAGTPIRAPAAGVVTLAEELHIYGNAVILSHGQGVSTSYNHLDAIDVEVGQRVAAGEVVGRMGSTGQSTGSHLHWGMVVAGVAVDPGEWTGRGFGADETGAFEALTVTADRVDDGED